MSIGSIVLVVSLAVIALIGIKVWWFMRWLKKKASEEENR